LETVLNIHLHETLSAHGFFSAVKAQFDAAFQYLIGEQSPYFCLDGFIVVEDLDCIGHFRERVYNISLAVGSHRMDNPMF